VSGNWTGSNPTLLKENNELVHVSLAMPQVDEQKQIHVPLTLSSSKEISSLWMRLTLDFDGHLLRGAVLPGGQETGLAAFFVQEHTVTLAAAFVTGQTTQQIDLILPSEGLGHSMEVTSLALNDNAAAEMSEKLVLQTESEDLPKNFELSRNYPNPFNASTTFQVSLPKTTEIEIRIFNLQGQLVRVLQRGSWEAGKHRVVWDGRDEQGQPISSGMFILDMNAGEFHAQQKTIMLK